MWWYHGNATITEHRPQKTSDNGWHTKQLFVENKIKTLNYNTPPCWGQIVLSNIDEFLPISNPKTRYSQYQCTYQVWWKSINVYSLSSGNQNMGKSRADNSVKFWRNLPISNLKPDFHNINAHTKFGENPLTFTQVIIRKRKTGGRTDGRTTDGRTDTWTFNVKP